MTRWRLCNIASTLRSMELDERNLDARQLKGMGTGELVRHALEETRLLVKAELLHAKQELRDEVKGAKTAGVLLGITLGLGISALSMLFVALALALPLSEPLAVLVVAAALLVICGGLAAVAVKRLPKRPLRRTQERLRDDFRRAREELQ